MLSEMRTAFSHRLMRTANGKRPRSIEFAGLLFFVYLQDNASLAAFEALNGSQLTYV